MNYHSWPSPSRRQLQHFLHCSDPGPCACSAGAVPSATALPRCCSYGVLETLVHGCCPFPQTVIPRTCLICPSSVSAPTMRFPAFIHAGCQQHLRWVTCTLSFIALLQLSAHQPQPRSTSPYEAKTSSVGKLLLKGMWAVRQLLAFVKMPLPLVQAALPSLAVHVCWLWRSQRF